MMINHRELYAQEMQNMRQIAWTSMLLMDLTISTSSLFNNVNRTKSILKANSVNLMIALFPSYNIILNLMIHNLQPPVSSFFLKVHLLYFGFLLVALGT